VLDQSLFEIDPHDIYKAKVLLTIMDGKVRHRDGLRRGGLPVSEKPNTKRGNSR
jgi:hypothetical protein